MASSFLAEMDEGQGAVRFRVQCNRCEGKARGVCVIVPSGRCGALDNKTEESAFYVDLVGALASVGVDTVRIDFQLRDNPNAPADESHIAARAARLRRVLGHEVMLPHLSNYVLFGLSLGAQVILAVASDSSPEKCPRALVLASCVLENPAPIMWNLEVIHLIYGSRDHIAYIGTDSNAVNVIAPNLYGPMSARMLLVRPKQKVAMQIWEGVGHMLANNEESRPYQSANRLAKLISSIL